MVMSANQRAFRNPKQTLGNQSQSFKHADDTLSVLLNWLFILAGFHAFWLFCTLNIKSTTPLKVSTVE